MSLRGRLVVVVLCCLMAYAYWDATMGAGGDRARARVLAANGQRTDCRTTSSVVKVKVSVSRYPENWRHMVDARAGRNTVDGVKVVNDGQRWPTILTVNRRGADDRREAAFAASGLEDQAGKARDEYPPAVLRTGNLADVRYVDRRANSGQGASMGSQLRRWCDGQRVRLVRAP